MIWRTRNGDIDFTQRARLMGIANVTVDSFSDGGKFLSAQDAISHCLEMVELGADFIDIGGESTRPGAEPVPEAEEMRRVLPVIEALSRELRHPERSLRSLRSARNDVLISIDTYKPAVARAAVAAGASIINDVTGLRDPEMLAAVRDTGAAVIAMHMRGTPRDMQNAPHYDDVVGEIRDFFRHTFERALACGIAPMNIAFDPGIGFGKTVAHNLALLKNLPELRVADRPLVVGVSRKSFLGKILGSTEMADRAWPTVALTSYLRERGANVIRVHDVQPNRDALRMTEAILG